MNPTVAVCYYFVAPVGFGTSYFSKAATYSKTKLKAL
jgi:hypothetical protein